MSGLWLLRICFTLVRQGICFLYFYFYFFLCKFFWDGIHTFTLTFLHRARWSSFQSSPRQACLHHASQIHKLQLRHSSDKRSDLHCQSVYQESSGSRVRWADSLACRSPGAISPPCVWHIQLQLDSPVVWVRQLAGRGADVSV